MNETEKRAIRVSKLVADNLMECALDFRSCEQQSQSLWDAIRLLNPQITRLQEAVDRIFRDKSDRLILDYQMESVTAAYVVGIIAGIHLAARADLIPRFCKKYAETTNERVYSEEELGEVYFRCARIAGDAAARPAAVARARAER
jgi:hypothetical protein